MTAHVHTLVVCYSCPETPDAWLAEHLERGGLIVSEYEMPCPFDRNRVGPHTRTAYRHRCVDPAWLRRWRREMTGFDGPPRPFSLPVPTAAARGACQASAG